MLLIKIERNLISRVLCATTGRGSNESLPKMANAFSAFFFFFFLCWWIMKLVKWRLIQVAHPRPLSRRCRRSVLRHRKNAAKVTSG